MIIGVSSVIPVMTALSPASLWCRWFLPFVVSTRGWKTKDGPNTFLGCLSEIWLDLNYTRLQKKRLVIFPSGLYRLSWNLDGPALHLGSKNNHCTDGVTISFKMKHANGTFLLAALRWGEFWCIFKASKWPSLWWSWFPAIRSFHQRL